MCLLNCSVLSLWEFSLINTSTAVDAKDFCVCLPISITTAGFAGLTKRLGIAATFQVQYKVQSHLQHPWSSSTVC